MAKSARRTGASRTGGARKTVSKLLGTPQARELITAAIVTAIATKVASSSARKAARQEVAMGGVGTSPGAILGSAVATVAAEAMQQLVKKSIKTGGGSRKATSRSKASGTRAKSSSAQSTGRKKPASKGKSG